MYREEMGNKIAPFNLEGAIKNFGNVDQLITWIKQGIENHQEVVSIKNDLTGMLNDANEFEIKTDDDLEKASQMSSRLKTGIKSIETIVNDLAKKANTVHRAITGKRAEILQPFKSAEDSIARKMSSYQTAKIQKQREEQQRLEAEARRKEEEKRKRLEQKALKAMENDETKAQELLQKAEEIFVPAVILPPVEKTVGKSNFAKEYQVTIIDQKTVLQAIIEGKLPLKAVKISTSELKKHVGNFDFKEGNHMGMRVEIRYVPRTKAA